MSLHTYYVFVTIVSLKQRIQSNKSKKNTARSAIMANVKTAP